MKVAPEPEPEAEPQPPTGGGIVNESDWLILPRELEKAIGSGQNDVYRRIREHFDRLLILRVMQQTGGNQLRASEILGLSRPTVRARLQSIFPASEKAPPPESERRP